MPRQKSRGKSVKRKSKKPERRNQKVSKTRYWKKPLITRSGERVIAHRRETDFRASIRTKKGVTTRQDLRNIFKTHYQAPFESYLKEQLKKKNGDRFILTALTSVRLRKKTIKAGFSLRRFKMSRFTREKVSLKMKQFEDHFVYKMRFYLRRKAIKGISFRGLSLEVIKKAKRDAVRAKTLKRKRK